MKSAALRKRWGRRLFDDGARIMLPPTELQREATKVEFGIDDATGAVTSFTVAIDDPEAARALLRAKFGPPIEVGADGEVYRARPRVILDGDEITVEAP